MNDFTDEDFGGFSNDEVIPIDTDNDGLIDSVIVNIDLDGDGAPDAMMIMSDYNADGIVDSEAIIADLDGDGEIDFAEVGFDSDGDGIMDLGFSGIDADGDLSPDFFAAVDSSGAIWGDVDSESFIEEAPTFTVAAQEEDSFAADFAAYNEVHGSPIEDMALWDQQDDPNSCAVASTNMMFRTMGLDVDESVIAAIFESRDIYHPEFGTDPSMIDDVINEMAIRADLDFHAVEVIGFTPENLQDMLNAGVRPLVGVDSSELYDDGNRLLNEMGLIPDIGHAVLVTGIIHNEEGDFVIINDPGSPQGAGQIVPMERFMNASEDFGHTAVAVIDGAPSTVEDGSKWGEMSLAGLSLGAIALMRSGAPQSSRNSDATR
jgi:hypothetical protein